MAATAPSSAVKVRPTADVPFFINAQSYPCHIPTPNGSGLDLMPGEVVIGKYFNKCVDRTPRAQGGNRSLVPTYDAIEVEKIKDPVGLLDDLLSEQTDIRRARRTAKGREDGSDGDRRGAPSLHNRTREDWLKYLVTATPDQIMQDHGEKRGSLQRIVKFLEFESAGRDATKLSLAQHLKTNAAAAAGGAGR